MHTHLGGADLSFLTLVDAPGNHRFHYRRATDGFLCHETGSGEVCEDFGSTVINLP